MSRAGFNLLDHLRFLDVWDIPSIGAPTTSWGVLRKDESHYIYLRPRLTYVTIHSDPVDATVRPAEEALLSALVPDADEPPSADERTADARRQRVAEAREFLASGRNRVAAFLPDQ